MPGVGHGSRRGLGEQGAELRDEGLSAGVGHADVRPGIGAELARSRAMTDAASSLCDLLAARRERLGQDEHRVGASPSRRRRGSAARAGRRRRRARVPPRNEPVKPTAWIAGCATSAWPTAGEGPGRIEKTPSGMPRRARGREDRASGELARCRGAPGAPSRRRGSRRRAPTTVSPPATENASGKFDAPNTATGPSGTSMRRRSGLGSGLRSGWARSMRASTHEPSSTRSAKRRAWLAVRARSPSRRGRGSPVSALRPLGGARRQGRELRRRSRAGTPRVARAQSGEYASKAILRPRARPRRPRRASPRRRPARAARPSSRVLGAEGGAPGPARLAGADEVRCRSAPAVHLVRDDVRRAVRAREERARPRRRPRSSPSCRRT